MRHGKQDSQDMSRIQHEAEHTPPRGKVSVFGYLAILFAAAFLLLLLSYFMQQRVNQDAIDDLTTSSNSARETLDNILSQNEALQREVSHLEDQLGRLEKEKEQSDAALAQAQTGQQELERQLEAMDWFWRIQREASRSNYAAARELIRQFEETGLPQHLPTVNPADPEGRTPAEQYQAVVELLT